MSFLLINCFLLVIKMCICKADDCSNERNENNQIPCCTHFYRDKGECKECLPGYFGTNCMLRCFYPTFGKRCLNTCICNISDCDPVSGCQGNDTEIETTAVFTRSWVSPTDNSKEKTDLYQDEIKPEKLVVIIVGCLLISLTVLNGVKWILKPIEKTRTIALTREANDPTTVYLEINEKSEQESVSNTMCTTVTSMSCTSLNGEKIAPPLPVRNTR